MKNVLVIGGGGREHALAWKLAQNDTVDCVYVAPGNAGTAQEKKLENVALDISDFAQLANFAQQNAVALTVIGPEQPLVDGIVDYFSARELPCFGPSAKAAQLEGSKSFTKDFLARNNIPTAHYQVFTDKSQALNYIEEKGTPIVIKADGLAAGKGVVVAMNDQQAIDAINDMLEANAFGEAGHRVVIEEFLEGEEASFIIATDGHDYVCMATSQDHKRVGEGDTGPNTGGMGAYSPAPVVTDSVEQRILTDVIEPTITAMRDEGNLYQGFLYAGLMIDTQGNPKVIEYNCRFGDPETQPIMMRMDSDLFELCTRTLDGTLNDYTVKWNPQPALGVVLAAKGYPQSYPKGDVISGLTGANTNPQHAVFHAGTLDKDGQTVTNGGRVLCATALGEDIKSAQANAYALAGKIDWAGMFYRKDIGYRAL